MLWEKFRVIEVCFSERNPLLTLQFDEYLQKKLLFTEGGQRDVEISYALQYFIVADNMPFNVVNNRGFRRLVKTLAPLYKLPARSTITGQIKSTAEALAAVQRIELSNADHLTITSDLWTDTMNSRNFLGTTVHYIKGVEFKTVKLGVIRMFESHTADNISCQFRKLLSDWDVNIDNVAACVTDNAANILKAVSDTFGDEKQLSCFAHNLNLVMESSAKCVAPIIDKVKAVVTFTKQSTDIRGRLTKLQNERGERTHKLKDHVATRWNSEFTMIERFIELAPDLILVLYNFRNAPPMPTPQELDACKELTQLMRPLNEATTEMSGESYVTISAVIPIFSCMHTYISKINVVTEPGKKLKVTLLQELEFRFAGLEAKGIYAKATVLDPRYKRLHFKRVICAAKAVASITKEAAALNADYCEIDPEPESAPCRQDESSSLWASHDAIYNQWDKRVDPSNVSQAVSDELHMYLSSPLEDRKSNPLIFWNTNKFRFPYIYKLAQKYLSIIATSVPAERLFSNAGDIMTPERNQLSDENLNNLIFLHGVPEEVFFSQK
jgi:hAT family C-terminal dimerisation region